MLLLAIALLLAPSDVDSYATRVAHKLAPGAEVRFVTDDDVWAGARPGGRIELSTGLFTRVTNEAELAGVLAHQIAHIATGTECIRYRHNDPKRPDDRQRERSADELAIPALIKANYDPAAMLQFFSRYRRQGAALPVGYSAEDLLIEKLQLEATDHPLKDVILNTPEFERLHADLR